ncbi:MAG: ATP-dependent DNA helicase [Oscillospiraceae bacterium]|jgi:DNA excision repair protein ERCC-2|nr:ATP-dependent DNA helicase [Oscillospiraceae bacterium]
MNPVISVSVREAVEFALLSGDLTPGQSLSRMREGTLAHQARQGMLPGARAEVRVNINVPGDGVTLAVSGRIDLFYEETDGVPVIEEIKLTPAAGAPGAALPAHWAQAVCYGHMLGVEKAVIRVLYVSRAGETIADFSELLSAEAMAEAFMGYVAPTLQAVEERCRWRALRDESIAGLGFPFAAFREGQRAMAVQVYWAIKQKKRLFAQAPTGTGKTAAALFPALKALGEGKTGQIFYLTARTTTQGNAATTIERMREAGLRLRVLTLTAKEKICPLPAEGEGGWRCRMADCPYALGFFDRLPGALKAMRSQGDWSRGAVEEVAEAHRVCPFEFSLSLCEEADAVIADYNYAFDPGARIRRVFQGGGALTLLVDEAHHLPERARDMLSAVLDGKALREARRGIGGLLGRRAPLYKALGALIAWVKARSQGTDDALPEDLLPLLNACMDAALAAGAAVPLGELPRTLLAALGALERFDEHYIVLTEGEGGHVRVTLRCLHPAPYLAAATRRLRGLVCFSATLTPLPAFREAIGGEEADALLSTPSPFPPENLLVLRRALSTRYISRENTAGAVAQAIAAMAGAKAGNYLVCFPSYAYLRRVADLLSDLPGITLHIQRSGMDDAARAEYLQAFMPRTEGALLGMVVMGGLFGEGIDLPGLLSGVAVVGVGLPQVCAEREALRAHCQRIGLDGFAHAYRNPGMNKVLQAVGRLIRTENDRGVALLIDDRFLQAEYAALMPPWWYPAEVVRDEGEIAARALEFWQNY